MCMQLAVRGGRSGADRHRIHQCARYIDGTQRQIRDTRPSAAVSETMRNNWPSAPPSRRPDICWVRPVPWRPLQRLWLCPKGSFLPQSGTRFRTRNVIWTTSPKDLRKADCTAASDQLPRIRWTQCVALSETIHGVRRRRRRNLRFRRDPTGTVVTPCPGTGRMCFSGKWCTRRIRHGAVLASGS